MTNFPDQVRCDSPIAPFPCRVNGEIMHVYLGSDGQLWRWVEQLGQLTLAASDKAADWLEKYAPEKRRLIEVTRRLGVKIR